jgi:hypothetical protein
LSAHVEVWFPNHLSGQKHSVTFKALVFQTSWPLAKKQAIFAPLFFATSCNEKNPNTLDNLGSYFLQFQT